MREDELRLNLPLEAQMRPIKGTFNIESELTRNIVEAVTKQPWQMSILEQF